MIDRTVHFLGDHLNQYLQGRFSIDDDIVSLSPITDQNGAALPQAANRLAMFVTNITEDKMPRDPSSAPHFGDRFAPSQPAFNLNIFLMLAANYDAENYLEALKVLSLSVQYFHNTPVFDRASVPELSDYNLDQLSLEISNMEFDTVGNLWGMFGGRYVPSVLYKVPTLSIDSNALMAEDSIIKGVDPEATTP